jgi:hypothetical protein
MTQSVNKETTMPVDPLFGLRIRRPPPHRDGQIRRSSARVLKKFEECLKRLNPVPDLDPSSGVLRQNDPDQGGEPRSLDRSSTPLPTPSIQNRQETPLEGGGDSGRPDAGPPPYLKFLNAI